MANKYKSLFGWAKTQPGTKQKRERGRDLGVEAVERGRVEWRSMQKADCVCVCVSRVLRVTNERLLALVVLPNPITIHTVYSAFVIILSMMTATAHYGCYILLCCIQYLYLGWSYLIVWPVVTTVCER